ncbi:hypothetical protein HY065_00440 [Candidatus Berkelbacteria bacterium]|nr:hypothetical protein [Candidatus Berkelbacteria bacterium]
MFKQQLAIAVVAFLVLFWIILSLISVNNEFYIRTLPSFHDDRCNSVQSLSHVWLWPRLLMMNPCVTVSGTVGAMGNSDDGDFDFLLAPDPRYISTLGRANYTKQKGNLVIEIVCAKPATNMLAKPYCHDYTNTLALPKTGDRITVSGAFLKDLLHGGWHELHPVYQLTIEQ